MLILLLFLLFVLTVTYAYGHGTLCVLARIAGLPEGTRPTAPLVCLVGFGALVVLVGYASLVGPISIAALSAVAAGVLPIGVWQRGAIVGGLSSWVRSGKPMGVWVLVGALALGIILLQATYPPRNYDTGLYHAQAIRWIEEHGAVPGLANLHVRFGFNSAWFLIAALFSFGFLPIGPLHALNAAVQVCFTLYALEGIKQLTTGSTRPDTLLKAALFAPALLYKADFSSDSPDLLAGSLVMVLFCLVLERATRTAGERDVLGLVIIWLSLLAATTKLSIAPVALLVPFVLWTGKWRDWRRLGGLATIGVLVLLPWLARFVVMTGYLLFPLSRLDLFSFDWKVPLGDVIDLEHWIYSWARIPRAQPADVLPLPYERWVPIWFANQLPINKLLVVGFVLGALGHLVKAIADLTRQRSRVRFGATPAYLHAVAVAGVCFWFTTAPDFRFGFGFLWAAIGVQALPLFAAALRRFGRQAVAALVFCVVAYEALELGLRVDWADMPDRLVVPAGYPPADVVPVGWFGQDLYVPRGTDQCWNAPRPCAPTLDPRLMPRGATLEDGFRVDPSVTRPGGP